MKKKGAVKSGSEDEEVYVSDCHRPRPKGWIWFVSRRIAHVDFARARSNYSKWREFTQEQMAS